MYKNYLRVTRSLGAREFIIGVEFFDDDNFETLRADATMVLEECLNDFRIFGVNENSKFFASVIKYVLFRVYPNRQFFLEIGNDDDAWVQVCPAEVSYVVN